MRKSIILTEEQFNGLILERLTSKVFHFTSLENLANMASENAIYLQSSLAGNNSDNYGNKTFYLSLTRNRNTKMSYGSNYEYRDSGVRIEFDGDALNNAFKGMPVDYWGDMGKRSYYNADTNGEGIGGARKHVRNEMEDRLLSDTPVIENAARYIKRIDVFIIPPKNESRQEDYNRYATQLRQACRWERLIHVYDNLKDFNYQTKNEIRIYNVIKDLPYDGNNNPPKEDRRGLIDIVKYYFAIKYFPYQYRASHERDVNQKIASEIKEYGLDWMLRGGIINAIADCNIYPFESHLVLANAIHDVSREPSRDGQKAVQMVSDCVRKSKQPTIQRWAKTIYDSFGDNKTLYDDERKVPCYALIYKGDDPNTARLLSVSFDPKHDSFWSLLRCDSQRDREWFMYTVENHTQKETYDENTDEWQRVHQHSSKSDQHFKKYLQHLIKNEPSVEYMLDFCQKLGISLDDDDFFGGQMIVKTTCNYWRLPYNTPQEVKDKYFAKK